MTDNCKAIMKLPDIDRTVYAGSCNKPSGNSTCVPSIFTSEVYYYGEGPVGFDDKLRSAVLYTLAIPGVSIEDVQVTQGSSQPDVISNESPAPGPSDRGITPSPIASVEKTQNSSNGPSPGAFVAVAGAALTLILVALFVIRRRHDAISVESQSKHREFTDDLGDIGEETGDDNSANSPIPPAPRKSYVISEQSLDESWNNAAIREGQDVHAGSDSNARHQSSQTTFMVADGALDPGLMNLPRRNYETGDTVHL
jgi:hypothetical protein